MIQLLQNIASYFIAEKLKPDPVTHLKAAVLVYLHLAMVAVLIVISFINNIIMFEGTAPSCLSIPIVGIILFLFKRTGNFSIAANFIAITWFFLLAPEVKDTGGVHSDNMIWLLLVPLFVMLFANVRLGLLWLLVLNVFYVYILIIGQAEPDMNKIIYSDNYYVMNYIVVSGFVFLLLKISESNRIKSINQLNEKNEESEEQQKSISEHADALKKIEEQLTKTNKELETFAYSASFDLKEPLRMVKMYTEFLKRSFKNQLQSNQLEYIGFITNGVTRMQNLLDDLLLYSRMGKNADDVKNVDMNERLDVVKHNLTVLIQETKAEVVCQELPHIKASETEMSQLFQNIIANAIKFRKQNELPKICVRVEETEKEYVFSIEDNGIGIKEEYQEQVFALFQKLHSSAVYEGSGIGLATCKKIVENMGGKMWLTSTENVGTTFFFTLPKYADSSKNNISEVNISVAA